MCGGRGNAGRGCEEDEAVTVIQRNLRMEAIERMKTNTVMDLFPMNFILLPPL